METRTVYLRYRGARTLLAVLSASVLSITSFPTEAEVSIRDAHDEGIACFEIRTDSATYFYDKAGAGFTSIVDLDGNDWVTFHPQGTNGVPNGQSGWYRGIPNMGLDQFGHPGYTGATSTTNDPKGQPLQQATIVSKKGQWHVTWAFFDSYARMTVHSVAENYWLLYEGTPGGAVGNDDTCYRSNGQTNALNGSWDGDVANNSGAASELEWVFFADGKIDRSLFMAHDNDTISDRYYLMSPMTVFGFGRRKQDLRRLLDTTPATLMIGLIDSRDPGTVGRRIADAYGGQTVPNSDSGGRAADDGGASRPVDAGPSQAVDSQASPSTDLGPGNATDDLGTTTATDAGTRPIGRRDASPSTASSHFRNGELTGQGCTAIGHTAQNPVLLLALVLVALVFRRRSSGE